MAYENRFPLAFSYEDLTPEVEVVARVLAPREWSGIDNLIAAGKVVSPFESAAVRGSVAQAIQAIKALDNIRSAGLAWATRSEDQRPS